MASCGTCAVVVLHGVAAWMAPCFRHRLVLSSCCCVRGCADSVASHIAAKGGIQSVIASMKSCSTKPDVQQYGAWALANVGWSDPDIKQRAVAAGEHRLPLPPPPSYRVVVPASCVCVRSCSLLSVTGGCHRRACQVRWRCASPRRGGLRAPTPRLSSGVNLRFKRCLDGSVAFFVTLHAPNETVIYSCDTPATGGTTVHTHRGVRRYTPSYKLTTRSLSSAAVPADRGCSSC